MGQTALMQLIQWIDTNSKDFEEQVPIAFIQGMYTVKHKAKEILEVEKEQIQEAYWEGHSDRDIDQFSSSYYISKFGGTDGRKTE